MISALSIVTPPATEPVTLALAKQHMRIDNTADDNLIPTYITAARTVIEQYLGRALISQQLLWTVANSSPPGGWPLMSISTNLFVFPQWFNLQMLGNRPLTLPRQPVISVDQVGIGQWSGADTVLETSAYGYNINNGRFELFGPSGFVIDGHLDITFTAGYGATGASVPGPIVQAILMMTMALYERRGDDGGEMPPVVEALLSPYRLISFGD